MAESASDHWREYLMEAGGLSIFMISTCVFTTVIEHPGSPIRQWIENAFVRRTIIGVAMGLTAIGLIYSPWGKQSGAHLSPSVTITFFRLGKLTRPDAFFYVLAQFVGAAAGVLVSTLFLRHWISHPAVNYAVTVPGPKGASVAFVAECVISFVLMTMILFVSNGTRLSAFTGVLAGISVATYISLAGYGKTGSVSRLLLRFSCRGSVADIRQGRNGATREHHTYHAGCSMPVRAADCASAPSCKRPAPG